MTTNAMSKLPRGIAGVISELVVRLRPERVVLFGSYAYGQPHPHSDIDVLVITREGSPRDEIWRLAHELGRRLGAQLHIVVMTLRECQETRDVVGGLAYPAHHWGIVLYDAPP